MKILVLPAYYYPEQAASPYLGDNIREAMCNAGFILDRMLQCQREEYLKKYVLSIKSVK